MLTMTVACFPICFWLTWSESENLNSVSDVLFSVNTSLPENQGLKVLQLFYLTQKLTNL